ncbi:hypothetical protein FRC03_007096 [Tulasnella sp. 419]|nr:hypothetical protein FRC03_007096 [Tulasnella sp. 419]
MSTLQTTGIDPVVPSLAPLTGVLKRQMTCALLLRFHRDILELKQIQLELLPDRRGIIRDQYEFDFDCEGDVDRSSRSGGARPRYLKRVPLELCPILPAAPASTPDDSARSSPMQSPLHTPPRSLSPARSPPLQKPQPKPLMTFLPILPPSAPPSTESTPNLLTPPQTPDPSPLQNHETPTVPVSRTTSSPSPSSSSPADKLPSTPAPTPSIFTRKECASNAKQHFNLLPIVPCTAPLISSPPVSRSPIHLRGMSCAAASNRPIVGSAMTPRRSTELSPSSSMFPPPFTIAYKAHATTI